MAWLCERYWQPLYAFVRRRGYTSADAQDLTQAFFVELLERDTITAADPQRGRFRTFLLACLTNFLNNAHDRAQALKRGGGKVMNFAGTAIEPTDDLTPERAFDRTWARTLLLHVRDLLAAEHTDPRRARVFAALEPYLVQNADAPSYIAAGTALGMSEGAIKVAVHRLRQRYREILRAEIAETLEFPEEGAVDAELQELLAALGG